MRMFKCYMYSKLQYIGTVSQAGNKKRTGGRLGKIGKF